ncbi:MAG: alpha-2-macroglobulin family protein, partial [Pseudomonadota bacterium]
RPVAEALGMTAAKDLDKRIADAIASVLENQSGAGSFGLWRPDRGDLWLDSYVTDFLSRAKAEGHAVPAKAFEAALDNLLSNLSYVSDFDQGGEDIAYALMVLAREGAASIGDLRYFADAKAEAFATPLAKAQIGAALAYYGEQVRADRMFRLAADEVLNATDERRGWRSDYGSHLRDGAALIALAAEAGSNAVNTQAVIAKLTADPQRWHSTQEKVWMLMATHAVMEQVTGDLTLNGQPLTGPAIRMFDPSSVAGGEIVIRNNGAPTEAVLTTFGIPVDPEPAGGNGYSIERAYYTMDGTEVSPQQVSQNDRLAVVVTVTPTQKRTARLMVDDPLPAGFEIDNPNLLQSGSIAALDWLKTSGDVMNTEFRTERFLAAVDHSGENAVRLAYIVRAVSPGLFHHPAALVEDMYRPDFRAWTDTGTVEVLTAP